MSDINCLNDPNFFWVTGTSSGTTQSLESRTESCSTNANLLEQVAKSCDEPVWRYVAFVTESACNLSAVCVVFFVDSLLQYGDLPLRLRKVRYLVFYL